MNAEAFREIYDAYYHDVMRFIRGAVHNESDIEEIAQDVFVKVARNYESYRMESQLRTWIYAITKNAITDHWRKVQRQRQKDMVDFAEVPESHLPPSSHQPDISTIIEQEEQLLLAKTCIEGLPEPMRLVLLCRLYQDLSVNETAEALGWSAARVRVTHMRALKKFQQAWAAMEKKTNGSPAPLGNGKRAQRA